MWRFGGIRAVDGVTFEIAEREIVGMIVPNGAGKTTVFDLISGFTGLDTGRIEIGGRDVTALGPSDRFARASAGPSRTHASSRAHRARDPVGRARALGRQQECTRRRAAPADGVFEAEESTTLRVDELLDLMGLGDYAGSFVRELSTGTRRVVTWPVRWRTARR